MTEVLKNKIITRAIHFIATNTKDNSKRIGDSIIEELKQIKLFTIAIVSNNETVICKDCEKYKKLQGNGIVHQLCECNSKDF